MYFYYLEFEKQSPVCEIFEKTISRILAVQLV